MSHLDKPLHPPILCYVTDRRSLASKTASGNYGALLKRIADAGLAGIDWIQIREKDLSGKEYSLLTHKALLQTKRSNRGRGRATRILVNDRLDVALAERTDGVHLSELSVPVQDVCKWLQARPDRPAGDKFLVGASCHSIEAASSAAHAGVDYIFFGPVFATPSKAVFGVPQGLESLAEICRSVSVPVLAIGGVTRDNAHSCFTAGATGIAAVRLFQDSGDLPSLVKLLRATLN